MGSFEMYRYDKLNEETIERVVNPRYAQREGTREPNVDWAVIKELKSLVLTSTLPEDQKNDILEHLSNAQNEKLSDQVRMHHFDIAGSRAWIFGNHFGAKYDYVDRYMTLFIHANGK